MQAPTGKVTIVFTDVQGSTVLWEDAPVAMEQALALHNALFRRFISEFSGYEVKTVGDAFMVAFDSSQLALACCARIQTELVSAPWPAELLAHPMAVAEQGPAGEPLFAGLRVRMGMHTGEPQCHADPMTKRMDYFGPMVNRAARVAGVAHGGQILMSADALAAYGASLAPLVATELGSFKLKGLAEPEQLVQVLPPSLTGRVFAPPKATPAITNAPAVEDENDHFITMLQADMPALDAQGSMHHKVADTEVSRPTARPVAMALELDTTQRDAERALAAEAAARAAEPKKVRSLKPLWIAASIVFVAALGYGAYNVFNQPMTMPTKPPTLSQIGDAAEKLVQQVEKAAASLPAQAKSHGMLRVVTKPSDAEIFVDGKSIGESPLGLDNDFAEGEHQLVAKKKKKWVAMATFNGGEDVRLELKLAPIGKKPKKKR